MNILWYWPSFTLNFDKEITQDPTTEGNTPYQLFYVCFGCWLSFFLGVLCYVQRMWYRSFAGFLAFGLAL